MNVSDDLDRIDWDFPRAGTDVLSVHSTHWFPGNFISQIPTAFIQVLSKPGDLVLDPFGGSGTTAVEAVRLGRRAILSDRLSACLLVAQGKLEVQTFGLDRDVKNQVLSALTWRHECYSESCGLNGEGSDPVLLTWFAPTTLSQLRYLWLLIEKQPGSRIRHILSLLFSDVLFACASPGRALTSTGKRRRHHWGWVADNVRPQRPVEHDAIGLFEARLTALPAATSATDPGSFLLVQQDARQLALSSNRVDLVVTSPPYINVIDYARANRLLYTWMGWLLEEERDHEIGARFKRHRANSLKEYLDEMHFCWDEIHRVLSPGGYCAVVIGESRRFSGAVEQTLSDLSKLMRKIWGPRTRRSSRRRVSDRGAHSAVEHLYVFQKP